MFAASIFYDSDVPNINRYNKVKTYMVIEREITPYCLTTVKDYDITPSLFQEFFSANNTDNIYEYKKGNTITVDRPTIIYEISFNEYCNIHEGELYSHALVFYFEKGGSNQVYKDCQIITSVSFNRRMFSTVVPGCYPSNNIDRMYIFTEIIHIINPSPFEYIAFTEWYFELMNEEMIIDNRTDIIDDVILYDNTVILNKYNVYKEHKHMISGLILLMSMILFVALFSIVYKHTGTHKMWCLCNSIWSPFNPCDDSNSMAILLYGMRLINVYGNLYFIVYLFKYKPFKGYIGYNISNIIVILCGLGYNISFLNYIPKKCEDKAKTKRWLSKYNSFLYALTILSMSVHESILVCNSKGFGLNIIDMGISNKVYYNINPKYLLSVISVNDILQIIFKLVYVIIMGNVFNNFEFTFTFCFNISILILIVSIYAYEINISYTNDKSFEIEFCLIDQNDKDNQYNIRKRCHLRNKLCKYIASCINMDSKSVKIDEIYYLNNHRFALIIVINSTKDFDELHNELTRVDKNQSLSLSIQQVLLLKQKPVITKIDKILPFGYHKLSINKKPKQSFNFGVIKSKMTKKSRTNILRSKSKIDSYDDDDDAILLPDGTIQSRNDDDVDVVL